MNSQNTQQTRLPILIASDTGPIVLSAPVIYGPFECEGEEYFVSPQYSICDGQFDHRILAVTHRRSGRIVIEVPNRYPVDQARHLVMIQMNFLKDVKRKSVQNIFAEIEAPPRQFQELLKL